jgi:YVTN family beta-propeller protein
VAHRSYLAVMLVAALVQACSTSPATTRSPRAAPTHSTPTWPQPVAIDACTGSASPSGLATSEPSEPSPTPEAGAGLPLVASISLPMAGGVQIATGFGAVWLRLHDGRVARIDPAKNRLVATIAVGYGEFGDIGAGEGGVWVTTFDEDKLSRIDPATNRIVAEVRVGTNPEAIGFTPGAVWVADHRGGTVTRVDPKTNTVVATIAVGPKGPSGPKRMVVVNGGVWTALPNSAAVVRIDVATNRVDRSYAISGGVDGLTSDGEVIYVAGQPHGIHQVDPTRNCIARTPEDPARFGEFGLGAFWTVEGGDLLRLERQSLAPCAKWRVFDEQTEFVHVAFGEGSIWLAPDDLPKLVRVRAPGCPAP